MAEQARLVAKSAEASIHVITVVPDSGMAIVAAALGPDHDQKLLAAANEEAAKLLSGLLPDAKLHVVQGSIYDSIIRTANKLEADMIVIGSHRPELRDYLVGPNAARVARHARQSVLIVR